MIENKSFMALDGKDGLLYARETPTRDEFYGFGFEHESMFAPDLGSPDSVMVFTITKVVVHLADWPWPITLPRGAFAQVATSPMNMDGCGIAIRQPGYRGTTMFGGPIERQGRLNYIDGCTDSLLIPPTIKGDPCLNHLHFPHGIKQTMHTHPSDRLGIVAKGQGRCVTPEGEIELTEGMLFVIKEGGPHCFFTDSYTMDVIAYHPDSDFGCEHEVHPMINRTMVDGVSASEISAIQTKGRATRSP